MEYEISKYENEERKKEKTGEKEKTLPPHQSICYTSTHPSIHPQQKQIKQASTVQYHHLTSTTSLRQKILNLKPNPLQSLLLQNPG